jgi:ABC-type uncharacterized transport system substrate-binding protein
MIPIWREYSRFSQLLQETSFTQHQKRIIELTDQHRLPAISWDPEFPKDGGLMSYSITVTTLDHYRQAAGYVDRILKGANPATCRSSKAPSLNSSSISRPSSRSALPSRDCFPDAPTR